LERTKPPFWMYNKWDKQLCFSTYHLSEELLPYYVEKLFEFAPQAIDAYPSAVYVLAKYMEDNNMTHKMKAVFTSSETLYPIQREVVENVFQCKIFDKYGLSEMFFVATECEEHEGLHLNMEYAITQVLNEQGEPVAHGTKGHIVCTGLENFSMPLIRYDTGDIGKFLPDGCPCGRNFSLMAPVTTKVEDQILTPDGRYISGSLLTFPFKSMKNIIKSQIVQDDIHVVKIKIVKNGFYNNEDSKILLEGLHECLGRNMQIVLEFVDDIERTKNGKYRWVISNVHRKMDFRKDNI
ncbi:MAG: phenylacetate--CoA ligase family protein, partial [Thermodesulfobacteriota bacterium]